MQIDFIIQMNILGLLILTIILFNLNTLNKSVFADRWFITMFYITMFTLVLDSLSYFLVLYDSSITHTLNFIVVTIIQINNILPYNIWIIIIITEMYLAIQSRKIMSITLFSIWTVIVVLLLSNPFTGLMFTFDSTHQYIRGPLFLIFPILNTVLVLIGLTLLLRFGRRLTKKRLFGLLLFIVPSGFGGLLQSAYPEYVTYWFGVSLGILVLFLYLYSERNEKDFLTGFFKKRHIIQAIDEYQADKIDFILCFIRLNMNSSNKSNMKINLQNEKIKEFSIQIHNHFNQYGTLARYDNSVFCLLLTTSEAEIIEELEKTIEESFAPHNDIKSLCLVNSASKSQINEFLK